MVVIGVPKPVLNEPGMIEIRIEKLLAGNWSSNAVRVPCLKTIACGAAGYCPSPQIF